MLKNYKLKNGLKVATYSIPQMKSVFLSEAIKGGSIFDTPSTSGLAHFMEHILVEGTPTFPNSEIFHEFIESLAGTFNAVTYPEMIKFYINGPANHIEDMVKISSEVFFEPLFPKNSVEKERGAIQEEIRQRKDADWYKKAEFFKAIRYQKGHPFLLDGGGSEDSIKRLQRKELVAVQQKLFSPKNTSLVIVGGFDPQKINDLLELYFGRFSEGVNFPGFPNLSNNDLSDRQVGVRYDNDLNTCYIDFSWPTISDDAPLEEQITQGVARNILGRLRTSRLYRLLRLQRGLVYGIDMGSATYQQFGFVYISTRTASGKVFEVVELIAKELASFVTSGPTDKELKHAKNFSLNQVLMQFDHPSNIAGWIEGDLIWKDKVYMPDEYAKMIEEVDKSRVIEFMKKYWDFKKLNLTVQGQVKNTKQNRKKFEKILEVL